MGNAPITTRGLNHFFGTGEARKQAIFDVNLEIEQGSLTILMGPSGSGKTTLLTLIGCLREVKDGSVCVLGHELNNAEEALLVGLRRRLGFIFQAHNLHESLTATQNVLMGLQVHGGRQRYETTRGGAPHSRLARPRRPARLFAGKFVWRAKAARRGGTCAGFESRDRSGR